MKIIDTLRNLRNDLVAARRRSNRNVAAARLETEIGPILGRRLGRLDLDRRGKIVEV